MQVEKNVNTYSFINAFVFTLGFLQRNLRYFPKNSILRVSTSSFRRNQSCEDQDIRWLGICNLQGVELMILKTLYDRIPCISRIPDWSLRITSLTCLKRCNAGKVSLVGKLALHSVLSSNDAICDDLIKLSVNLGSSDDIASYFDTGKCYCWFVNHGSVQCNWRYAFRLQRFEDYWILCTTCHFWTYLKNLTSHQKTLIVT